ncbi:hypothetical protein [Nitrospirillum iridis]|uniref:Uncharacterized protein n=1 Tax=Nitrospirillum iridis TaxID=765888 RepID=A0A7X0B2S4_9PROT|nr:hypothetical protein [Nitrospirillum iridis]MBB6253164.1 hypothetical protein [Nitrospirillum iridis]
MGSNDASDRLIVVTHTDQPNGAGARAPDLPNPPSPSGDAAVAKGAQATADKSAAGTENPMVKAGRDAKLKEIDHRDPEKTKGKGIVDSLERGLIRRDPKWEAIAQTMKGLFFKSDGTLRSKETVLDARVTLDMNKGDMTRLLGMVAPLRPLSNDTTIYWAPDGGPNGTTADIETRMRQDAFKATLGHTTTTGQLAAIAAFLRGESPQDVQRKGQAGDQAQSMAGIVSTVETGKAAGVETGRRATADQAATRNQPRVEAPAKAAGDTAATKSPKPGGTPGATAEGREGSSPKASPEAKAGGRPSGGETAGATSDKGATTAGTKGRSRAATAAGDGRKPSAARAVDGARGDIGAGGPGGGKKLPETVEEFTKAFNESDGKFLNDQAKQILSDLWAARSGNYSRTIAIGFGLIDGKLSYVVHVSDLNGWRVLNGRPDLLRGARLGPPPPLVNRLLPEDRHTEVTAALQLRGEGAQGVVVATSGAACKGNCEVMWTTHGSPDDVWHTHINWERVKANQAKNAR